MRWGYHVKDGFKFSCVLKEDPWMETIGHGTRAQNEEVLFTRALQKMGGAAWGVNEFSFLTLPEQGLGGLWEETWGV